jgi:HK97 family phage portal protein
VGLLSRIFRPSAAKSVEGQYRDGPWYLPLSGGWLPQSVGQNLNWWQMGFDPIGSETTSMVEACVSAYSQTVAMCPGDHWRANDKGGRKRVTNSALARLLRTPNDYQSISDFLLNLTRSLYLDGNAYALALRNDRFEITELHLMHPRHSMPQIAPTGEVFYSLGGNPIIDHRMSGLENKTLLVPQRDVLHVRLQTPMHPLRGESPIRSAMIDIATSGAMSQQQFAFYLNQGRPSNVLATDLNLTKEQVEQLRDRWNDQSQRLAQGGTPILTNGLKPIPIYTSSRDAQLAEMMKLSEQHIALAFRMPLQILGIIWRLVKRRRHIDRAVDAFVDRAGSRLRAQSHRGIVRPAFRLKGQPDEYVEFSTAVAFALVNEGPHRGAGAGSSGRHLCAERGARRRGASRRRIWRRAAGPAASRPAERRRWHSERAAFTARACTTGAGKSRRSSSRSGQQEGFRCRARPQPVQRLTKRPCRPNRRLISSPMSSAR